MSLSFLCHLRKNYMSIPDPDQLAVLQMSAPYSPSCFQILLWFVPCLLDQKYAVAC